MHSEQERGQLRSSRNTELKAFLLGENLCGACCIPDIAPRALQMLAHLIPCDSYCHPQFIDEESEAEVGQVPAG